MKPAIALSAVLALALPSVVAAGGQGYDVSITALMANPEFRDKLPAGVKYYFGDEPVAVKSDLGAMRTSRRTGNGRGASSCDWAMTSALTALGDEALKRGGNAVVGIQSNLDGVATSSRTRYRCGVGNLMVNVALTGQAAVVE